MSPYRDAENTHCRACYDNAQRRLTRIERLASVMPILTLLTSLIGGCVLGKWIKSCCAVPIVSAPSAPLPPPPAPPPAQTSRTITRYDQTRPALLWNEDNAGPSSSLLIGRARPRPNDATLYPLGETLDDPESITDFFLVGKTARMCTLGKNEQGPVWTTDLDLRKRAYDQEHPR